MEYVYLAPVMRSYSLFQRPQIIDLPHTNTVEQNKIIKARISMYIQIMQNNRRILLFFSIELSQSDLEIVS
jgi:hypothetical protein